MFHAFTNRPTANQPVAWDAGPSTALSIKFRMGTFRMGQALLTTEDAVAYVEKLLDPAIFSTLKMAIFRATWQGQSYAEIAAATGYGESFIRNQGAELWRLLSTATGIPITKKTLKRSLRKYV